MGVEAQSLNSPHVKYFFILRITGVHVTKPLWNAFPWHRPACPEVIQDLLSSELTELSNT